MEAPPLSLQLLAAAVLLLIALVMIYSLSEE
jgi:hypothetical protein